MISVPILVAMSAGVVLLFTVMILTAMASTASKRGDDDTADKYSTWSSVLVGLTTLVSVIALGFYVYTNKFKCSYIGSS